MQIYKVLPSLSKERHLSVWHKSIRGQWSPDEVAWGTPQRISRERLKDGLARVVSPILMGEQAALYSITTLIKILGSQGDTESQFYLTSMLLDEARHTEVFARFYRRLDREPMSIRRFPAGYLFQARVMSEDPVDWMVGSLVSEVVAKISLIEMRALDADPVLTEVCDRVLEDEARHLGFNHVFLEGKSIEALENGTSDELAAHVNERLESVLETVPPMLDALAADLKEMKLEVADVFARVQDECRRRLGKSIESGLRRAAASVETAAT